MPSDGRDGASDGLLEVLGHPPVIFFLEIADGYDAGARTDGEFLLGGGPADECGGAVDAEEDEGGFPAGGGGFPYVCVTIWGYNLACPFRSFEIDWLHTL